jgi:hypothetical protein
MRFSLWAEIVLISSGAGHQQTDLRLFNIDRYAGGERQGRRAGMVTLLFRHCSEKFKVQRSRFKVKSKGRHEFFIIMGGPKAHEEVS